jgi:hypothetical protein
MICFGKGTVTSLGIIRVQTPLGYITFYIIPVNTPFLFCIKNMDKLGIKLNNFENMLVQRDSWVPIVCKWGHP